MRWFSDPARYAKETRAWERDFCFRNYLVLHPSLKYEDVRRMEVIACMIWTRNPTVTLEISP